MNVHINPHTITTIGPKILNRRHLCTSLKNRVKETKVGPLESEDTRAIYPK
jgi:hypothetical protein